MLAGSADKTNGRELGKPAKHMAGVRGGGGAGAGQWEEAQAVLWRACVA